MALVVDASVVCAWIFEDEATPAVDQIGLRVAESGAIVPALLPLEVANALIQANRRGRVDGQAVAESLARLERLGLTVSTHRPEPSRLVGLADDHGLTSYDAAYLDLALALRAALATLDQDLRRAAAAEGLAVLPA
ncbi:MAG: type II toxin-antitoxin system VapC family toxin [Bifidobacteriaceae bacterium]|jgi:predicted nucleic acid-binding protein|nr:type II toxin-antitoxin system VapC family toxin [Bifidobacteriaceae bacterium]